MKRYTCQGLRVSRTRTLTIAAFILTYGVVRARAALGCRPGEAALRSGRPFLQHHSAKDPVSRAQHSIGLPWMAAPLLLPPSLRPSREAEFPKIKCLLTHGRQRPDKGQTKPPMSPAEKQEQSMLLQTWPPASPHGLAS